MALFRFVFATLLVIAAFLWTAHAADVCCHMMTNSCDSNSTSSECAGMMDTFVVGGSCADCDQGACCAPDASCMVMSRAMCDSPSLFLAGATCEPGYCPWTLEKFVDEITVPLAATPLWGDHFFRVTMRQTKVRFHRDLPETTVWAYDGMVPGPTIHVPSSHPISVEWVNALAHENGTLRTTHVFADMPTCVHGPNMWHAAPRTVVHVHGTHSSQDSDGHSDFTVHPGQSQVFRYENEQAGSTLWYHDHALGVTRLNVEMGLAGFFLIHNPAHDALGLPSGEFDVPLMFLDRSFTREGDLFYSDPVPQHEFGRHMIVNGKAWPRMTVKRAAYRFRLLDASNHRHLDLSFVRTDTDETLSFQLIASDTGLIGAPRTLTNIPLVPSERWEIVLDFSDLSAGTEVLVKNSAAVMMMRMMGDMEMTPMMMAQMSAVDMPELMKFVVSSEQGPAAAVPSMLEPDYAARLPSASAVVGERHFVLRHGMDHAGDTMMTSGSMSGMSGGAMSAGGMSMTTTGGMGGMSSGMATGSGGMSSGMATGSGGMTSGMGGGGTMTMMMPMPNMSDPAEVLAARLGIGMPPIDSCAVPAWFIESANDGGHMWDDISDLPVAGTTERWVINNPTDHMHPIHIHLVPAMAVSRAAYSGYGADAVVGDDIPLYPWEAGVLKDVWVVPPFSRLVLDIHFWGTYRGRFPFHCHLLEHEDLEMMRQYRLINDAADCNQDGVCDDGEDCFSCPSDCGVSPGGRCGNSLCEAGDGENCQNCPDDCAGSMGGTFCCGLSGNCNMDPECYAGVRGCRENATVAACCGDQQCEGAETDLSCPVDCDANEHAPPDLVLQYETDAAGVLCEYSTTDGTRFEFTVHHANVAHGFDASLVARALAMSAAHQRVPFASLTVETEPIDEESTRVSVLVGVRVGSCATPDISADLAASDDSATAIRDDMTGNAMLAAGGQIVNVAAALPVCALLLLLTLCALV